MEKNNTLLEEKIIEMLDTYTQPEEEIIKLLRNKIENSTFPNPCNLYYCSCGYPLGFKIEDVDHKNESSFRYVLLYEILNYEADIDKFRTYTTCPKCSRLLEEVQY